MKRTLLISLSSILSLNMFAQSIPNGSFEEWTTVGISLPPLPSLSYEEPKGWKTINGLATLLGAQSPVVKSTESQDGDFSLQVRTLEFNNLTAVDTTLGLSWTSFKVDKKPLLVNGYYKASVKGKKDTLGLIVLAIRAQTSTQVGDTIGIGILPVTQNENSFTEFSVPLFYQSLTVTPDSLVIAVTSSANLRKKNTPGTTLWVDNLTVVYLGGPLGLSNETMENECLVYPNPSLGQLTISNVPADATAFKVVNSNGMEAIMEPIVGSQASVDISNLPKGVYHLQLLDKEQLTLVRKKIVLQ